jgi:hypothetical protein
MGEICGTRGRFEKFLTKFWSENPKGRHNLGNLGVNRWIILKWILIKWGFRV